LADSVKNVKYVSGQNGPRPEVEVRYHEALELYRTTTLPVAVICRRTNTSLSAFRSYVNRYHRDLLFARYGIRVTKREAAAARLRGPVGQTAVARAKYGEAIRACDDAEYIAYNVSQIARAFRLNPSSLSHQLRVHYPEILERREKERQRLGVNDNLPRGVKPWCREQYAAAVTHLCSTDDTIRHTAALFGLSYSGLREHLLYYHKEIVSERARKRKCARRLKKRGALTGSGSCHLPSPDQVEKYGEAVRLYRTTAMTQKEIAAATGVPLNGLRNHLRMWHRELILEHRGVKCDNGEEVRIAETKPYLKSTAAKYAGAIRRLKETGHTAAGVAKEFGLNPETFRKYLYEHEPELAAGLGRMRLPNGKVVSARSAGIYAEAVRLYETTAGSLKSIADRLGVPYKSVGGFIRRNRPEVIEAHRRLVERAENGKREEKLAACADLVRKREEEEKQRILQVLKQTGGRKRMAAKILGIGKSTLYNKLKAFGGAENE